MRQSRLIISNAVVMWGTQVLRLIPQLILVPFLISTIGETGYGDYTLVWSLITSIEGLHRSLQSGVVKYGAAFLANDRLDKVNQVVSSSFVFSLILGLVTCLGIIGLSFFYGRAATELGMSLIVVGLMVLFIFPLTPYTALIQSKQRFYIGAIAETAWKYLTLIAVLVWFRISTPSLLSLIIIMSGLLIFSRLGQVPFAFRLVPGLKNRVSLFDKEIYLLIASFGGLTVLISASLALNTTGVRWLMGELVDSVFVAHLAIMLTPEIMVNKIIKAITITIMPATSAYEAKGNLQALQRILKSGIRYTNLILAAGFPAAILLMRDLLVLWVGDQYAFLTPYTLILFLGAAIRLSASTAHHMLKGLDEQKKVLVIYLVSLVMTPLVLILAIYRMTEDPYLAAALGLGTGYIFSGLLQIYYGAKVLDFDLKRLVLKSFGEPLLPALLILPAVFWIITQDPRFSFITLILFSLLSVLIYLGIFYFGLASQEERSQGLEIIGSLRRRLPRIGGKK